MEKIFNHKSFKFFFFFLTPLGFELTYDNLPTVANLTPVSTTLAKLVAKFAVGVVDTGGAP